MPSHETEHLECFGLPLEVAVSAAIVQELLAFAVVDDNSLSSSLP